jgi:hypothetical protein
MRAKRNQKGNFQRKERNEMGVESLHDWKKRNGYRLPLFVIAKIVGMKCQNYFNELWNKDEDSRERVKKYVAEAEERFKDICV